MIYPRINRTVLSDVTMCTHHIHVHIGQFYVFKMAANINTKYAVVCNKGLTSDVDEDVCVLLVYSSLYADIETSAVCRAAHVVWKEQCHNIMMIMMKKSCDKHV